MSTGNIPGVNVECLAMWEPETAGNLSVCLGLQGDCFIFTYILPLPLPHTNTI